MSDEKIEWAGPEEKSARLRTLAAVFALLLCLAFLLTLLPVRLGDNLTGEPDRQTLAGIVSMSAGSEHRGRIADAPVLTSWDLGFQEKQPHPYPAPVDDQSGYPPECDLGEEQGIAADKPIPAEIVAPGADLAPAYHVQIGAFQERDNALRVLSAARKRFPQAGMEKVRHAGSDWLIVFIDRFHTVEQAQEAAAAYMRESGPAHVVRISDGRYAPVEAKRP